MKFMKTYMAATATTMVLLIGTTDLFAASSVEGMRYPIHSSSMTGIGASDLKSLIAWYSEVPSSGALDPIPLLKENPSIKERFTAPAGVTEGYTIEEHTARVLVRFDAVRSSCHLPAMVNEKDFALFLSLHDIGKHQAKVDAAAGLYNTQRNQKALELLYSRRIFKEVARSIGMKPETVKVLSRLLHSDTIGEYLKGLYNEDAAYNLLVRDGHKGGVDPQDFAQLHVLFHRLDAGSHPTLTNLFVDPEALVYAAGPQEKVAKLQGIFAGFKAARPDAEKKFQAIIGLMESWNAAEDYSQQDRFVSDITGLLPEVKGLIYKLRLEAYYAKGSELFTSIQTIFARHENSIKAFEKSKRTIISSLFEGVDGISSVHGANSGVLPGLMQTAATLYPTGLLTKLGITPLSGELGVGASATGINKDTLSGNMPTRFEHSLEEYASRFQISVDKLCESIVTYIRFPRPTLEVYPPETRRAGEPNYRKYGYDMQSVASDNRQRMTTMSFTITQLKALSQTPEHMALLETLKSKVTEDLAQWNDFEILDVYKTHMPEELGGTWGDDYYANTYSLYKAALENCVKTFDVPVNPLLQEHLAIAEKPFPILFATLLPWRVNTNNIWHTVFQEVNYSGPLTLGKDVPYMFVPEEYVGFVKVWVAANVFGKKKPLVLAIDGFRAAAGLPAA